MRDLGCEGLLAFGYTDREAEFLYLAATHSGHFLRRHFLAFAGETRCDAAERFLARARRLRHVSEAPYGRRCWRRYHVNAFAVYEAIGKEHSAHRKCDRSGRSLAAKMLALDFVIAHPGVRYLEEERDKVAFFTEQLGVPVARLPHRLSGCRESALAVKRYFVDKFPLYVREAEGSITVGLTYMHGPDMAVRSFGTYLTRHAPLLGALPVPYEVVFVSESPRGFAGAQRIFERMRGAASPMSWDEDLRRYFGVRRAFEAKEWKNLTPADYEFRIRAAKRYREPHHELLYQEWLSGAALPECRVQDPGGSMRGQLVTYIPRWARDPREESDTKTDSGTSRRTSRGASRGVLARNWPTARNLGPTTRASEVGLGSEGVIVYERPASEDGVPSSGAEMGR